MDTRDAVAWLHRRAGLGLSPNELDAAVARGASAELDRLLSLSAGDPWAGVTIVDDPMDRQSRVTVVSGWLDHLVGSTSPLADRMTWFWHGHLVSALSKVRSAGMMAEQIRLYARAGLGSFQDLIRATSIDRAMLVYLDGRESTGTAPNENYGRELMELFTLGVGNYTEADVQAAARALTGWSWRLGEPTVRFMARRHDDHPSRFLGVDGVHDLDTVLGAIEAHPASAPFIARSLAYELLGTAPDDLVADLAAELRADDWNLSALVRNVLSAGLAGTSAPVVRGPVLWLVAAQRATGARVEAIARVALLREAGQLPLDPPNVSGWPGGPAWFASNTVVARSQLAVMVAHATASTHPIAQAAAARDLDALASALAIEGGFGAATAAAVRAAADTTQAIALALVSPEFVIA